MVKYSFHHSLVIWSVIYSASQNSLSEPDSLTHTINPKIQKDLPFNREIIRSLQETLSQAIQPIFQWIAPSLAVLLLKGNNCWKLFSLNFSLLSITCLDLSKEQAVLDVWADSNAVAFFYVATRSGIFMFSIDSIDNSISLQHQWIHPISQIRHFVLSSYVIVNCTLLCELPFFRQEELQMQKKCFSQNIQNEHFCACYKRRSMPHN